MPKLDLTSKKLMSYEEKLKSYSDCIDLNQPRHQPRDSAELLENIKQLREFHELEYFEMQEQLDKVKREFDQ